LMTTCYCTSSAQSLDDNMLLYKFSTKSWWQHVIVQVQHMGKVYYSIVGYFFHLVEDYNANTNTTHHLL